MKKGFLYILFIAISFSLILSKDSLYTAGFSSTPVYADDAADLKKQIDERNKNIAQLEQEIAEYTKLVDKTSGQAKTLATSIKSLQTQGKKLDLDIKLTNTKITNTQQKITLLTDDISQKQQDIDREKSALIETINAIDQIDSTHPLIAFASAEGGHSKIDGLFQNAYLGSAIRDDIQNLLVLKTDLQGKQKDSIAQKADLMTLQDNLKDQKSLVLDNQKQQDQLLKDTKNQESTYQQIVVDKQKKKAQFEKELFDYEAQLQYILNPSSLPTSGSSPLAWPLDSIYITQLFGKTEASGRLYVSGTHNGVDFKATQGTAVKAMGSGTVLGVGDTDVTCPRASFGRWVFIKYNNGLSSTFGHLSVIKAQIGDKVKTGDIVGYSGNTGYSTGAHLHVSIYASDGVEVQTLPSKACNGKLYTMPIAALNAYLDPMLYFPPYKK